MIHRIIRIDKDVVEVHNNRNIKQIGKDIVHEALESHQSIGKTERHDHPFKGTIACAKRSLPFITFSYLDKMVCMMEVNFGVDSGLAWRIERVQD